MRVEVVPYSEQWPVRFAHVAAGLRTALDAAPVPVLAIEHVGSTSVPGLAAKPVLDVDVVVEGPHVLSAITALSHVGYLHRGDLGVTGREALTAPDDDPRRNVYVCLAGTLHVRNHLAVRAVLRRRDDLRDEYAAVKLALAARPGMDIDTYLAGKTEVLQRVLAESDLTARELREIRDLNAPGHAG